MKFVTMSWIGRVKTVASMALSPSPHFRALSDADHASHSLLDELPQMRHGIVLVATGMLQDVAC